ncbi:aldoxime dehydratase [Fusarium coicis]|nr:aldoxime dehydratase [Fusarium coicis]
MYGTFDKLITGQAHLERVTVPGTDEMSAQIWLSYWWPESHAKWWPSPDAKQFWDELLEDAGVWREIITATANRVQNACTAELKNRMNGLGEMEPFGDKIGYWGCVRHHIPDVSLGDKLASSLEEMPARVPETTTIRPGRVIVTDLPDNICFLVEGQDHSGMSAEEKALLFEDFDELATGWMGNLTKDTTANGIFDVEWLVSQIAERSKVAYRSI